MSFLDEWSKQAAEQISVMKGIPLNDALIKKIKKIGCDRVETFDVFLHNNLTDEVDPASSLDLADYYLDDNPVMTGYGVFYKQHADSLNLPAQMLAFLGKERKRVKKEMFLHVNDEDKTIHDALDTKQKVIKVLMNSWYGVMGQRSFIFHNEYNGPAITYTAYNIITNTMLSMEAFLANNVEFRNFDQVVKFVTDCVNFTPRTPLSDVMDEKTIFKVPDICTYLEGLCGFEITESQKLALRDMIGGYMHEDIWKIYLKRNLYEFLKLPVLEDMLGGCLDEGFINPDEPPEAIKETIDGLYALLEDYVGYDTLYEDRFDRAHTMKRKVILVVDTDSNFINLLPFYEFMADRFDLGDKDDRNIYIPVCNIMTHVLSRYIHKVLHLFAKNMNLTPDNQKFLAMKSEFLFSRVVLTDNKKQYAANIVLQEGNVLTKPKLEMKGISIKKVGVNKITREYFTKILEDMMLNAKDIDIPAILRKYWEYEKTIRRGLITDMSTQYCTPGKYSSHDSYKNPWQMDVVRGSELWNFMNESTPIGNHSKVNKIKLRSLSREELILAMAGFPNEMEDLLQLLDQSEMFQKYGFNILCLPKDVRTIPDWVAPIMDHETMVSDIMGNTIVLLESLGIQLLTVRSKNYYSNLLKM